MNPQRKSLNGTSRIFLVLILGISITALLFTIPDAWAGLDGSAPPNDAEQGLFNTLRDRVLAHSGQWPHSVEDKIQTTFGGLSFVPRDCSGVEGTTVDEVRMTVNGKLLHFDDAVARNNGVPNAGPNDAGYDIWKCDVTIETNEEEPMRIKNLTCENHIMLNQPQLTPFEGSGAGMILSESVLYHEFLHGQFVIDAYFDDDYIEKACKSFPDTGGNIDLSPLDTDHVRIGPLETQYILNVAAVEEGTTAVVNNQITSAQEDCSFSIDVSTLTEKSPFTFQVIALANIAGFSVPEGGTEITGTLETNDAGNCLEGSMLILIDPPSQAEVVHLTILPPTIVGGELLQVDNTALLLAGVQTFSWMIPVVLSGIGIGLFVASRKSENS